MSRLDEGIVKGMVEQYTKATMEAERSERQGDTFTASKKREAASLFLKIAANQMIKRG